MRLVICLVFLAILAAVAVIVVAVVRSRSGGDDPPK